MRMEHKAFLAIFCGSAMFFLLTMLPIMYIVDDKILKLHDTNWFIQFAAALVFVSALLAGMAIILLEVDKDKRLVQLQLAIHYGWNFILHWNFIGWAILLGLKMYTAASVVSHQMCHDDEVPGK